MVWVLFDYAQVISAPQPAEAIATMANAAGSEEAAFEAAYWLHRGAYDRGEWTHTDYWQAVGGTLGIALDDAATDELNEHDVDSWLHLNEATLDVVRELHDGGTSLAVLSNAPRPVAAAAAHQEWAGLFGEHLYFSADLGLVKPSPQVFTAVLERLAAGPDEVVFVDDRADNVAAADSLGMRTVHFRDAAQLRDALVSAGVL